MFALSVGCCCAASPTDPCVIGYDPFASADTTTPPGWYEAAGDWEIIGAELVPDPGGSNQRIMWTTRTDVLAVGHRVTVNARGTSGDLAGVGFFFCGNTDTPADAYAIGDWIEVLVRFNSGTAGRITINVYNNSSIVKSYNESLECGGVNEYDIPPDEVITITLCWRYATLLGTQIVAIVQVGTETHELGFFAEGTAAIVTQYGYAALITGANSLDVAFDNFDAQYVSDECEDCLTCVRTGLEDGGDTITERIAANYSAEAGTWTQSSDDGGLCVPGFQTSDTNAQLILTLMHSYNDDLAGSFILCNTDMTPPFKARYLFSWVDDTTFWYFEVEVFDDESVLGSGFYPATLRVVDDSGVTQWVGHRIATVNLSGSGIPSRFYLYVKGCRIHVGYNDFVWCAVNSAALNDTGIVGMGTGDVVTDQVIITEWQAGCNPNEWDCTDGWIGEDPDDPTDPGDPPGDLVCCDAADGVEVGSTTELTISDLGILVACLSDPCIGDLVTFLGLLNATHTLTCVWASSDTYYFFLDTGLDPPCETTPSSQTVEIRLWIFQDGGQCIARIELWAGSTCIIWLESTFAKALDESCDGFSGTERAGFGNSDDCCIDVSLVSWSLNFN